MNILMNLLTFIIFISFEDTQSNPLKKGAEYSSPIHLTSIQKEIFGFFKEKL